MKTLILIFHLLVCIFEIWMLSDFYDAFFLKKLTKFLIIFS